MNPICPYCNQESELTDSAVVYGRSYGMIYLCKPCDAYVGTHKSSNKPLGRLANARLRRLKMRVHKEFDPIWQRGPMSRKQAYAWLSLALNIHPDDCHVGTFDDKRCEQALSVINSYMAVGSLNGYRNG